MDLKTRITTALAVGSLTFGLMAPAAMAADLEISGNGFGSNNTINVTNKSNVTVNQTSNTTVSVGISASSNTGGNSASFNNGGNTTITTGNATTNVSVNVTGGSNDATVAPCGCNNSGNDVTISGNSAFSKNKVTDYTSNTVTVKQKSLTTLLAEIYAKSKTGKNNSSFNNGGSTNVTTNNSNTNVSVNVAGGSNTQTP